MNPAPASSVETVEGLTPEIVQELKRLADEYQAARQAWDPIKPGTGAGDPAFQRLYSAECRLANAVQEHMRALLRDREERERRVKFLEDALREARLKLGHSVSKRPLILTPWSDVVAYANESPNLVMWVEEEKARVRAEYLRSRTQGGAGA